MTRNPSDNAWVKAGLIGGGTVSSGTDVGLSRTFSYEGAAQVIVHDSDTKEEGDAPGT